MECKKMLELFSDYYDESLSAFKRETVTKHFLSCKSCSLKYKTYCEALAYIKTVPDEELPEEFYSGLDRKLEEASRPFYFRFLPFLNLKNSAVAVSGVFLGLLMGLYISGFSPENTVSGLTAKNVPPSFSAEEKVKNTNRLVMKTGNVYKASYDLDRLVSGFDSAGLEPAGPAVEPGMRVLNKKYIITVNASQYENLVKQLNALGYVMRLPDKKEQAEIKKLKSSDQIKFELEITEDGK